jgi:hypothetical protein
MKDAFRFTGPAVELPAVIKADHDKRVADADAETCGLVQIGQAEIRRFAPYVADVGKYSRIESLIQRRANLVIQEEQGLTANRLAVRQLGAEAIYETSYVTVLENLSMGWR